MNTYPAFRGPDKPQSMSDIFTPSKLPARLMLTAAEVKLLARAQALLENIGIEADKINPDGYASDHAIIAASHIRELMEDQREVPFRRERFIDLEAG